MAALRRIVPLYPMTMLDTPAEPSTASARRPRRPSELPGTAFGRAILRRDRLAGFQAHEFGRNEGTHWRSADGRTALRRS